MELLVPKSELVQPAVLSTIDILMTQGGYQDENEKSNPDSSESRVPIRDQGCDAESYPTTF
jgi:hypothetical protein